MKLPQLPCQGCIFDFDGVIVDTERYHYAAWNQGAAPAGVFLTWEEYLPLKSTGRSHIMNVYAAKAGIPFSPEFRTAMAAEKDRAFAGYMKALSEKDLIPGVLELLEALSARGIPMAIASSSAASGTLAAQFGLCAYFSAIIDGTWDLPKKPAPDLFLTAARALDLPAQDCLVFEDSLAGIQAAANAGMPVIAVGGIRSPLALTHISDFTELERMCFL